MLAPSVCGGSHPGLAGPAHARVRAYATSLCLVTKLCLQL